MWKPRMNWAVLALPAVMLLNVPNADGQGLGYVLAGPVGITGFVGPLTSGHVGGGGEFLIGSPFAVGAEIGVMSYGAIFAVNAGMNLGLNGEDFPRFVTAYPRARL
jgi:hypothetical protein